MLLPKLMSRGSNNVYIAVMGVTGAGKSRFISACTGQDVAIGHTLESCTTEVDDYTFTWGDITIHLIDTPGFDDTHKSDREVLEGIATWMSTAYAQDIKLSGILYLHRITDVRVGGTSLRNLTMFKKLCGNDFYPRVFLVTTMWDKVGSNEGETREQELISKSDFWGTMIGAGACVSRHHGTRDSAMNILRKAIQNRNVEASKVLKVQHEMVDDGLRLDQTSAGRLFEAELLKQREKHERQLRDMQEDVKVLLEMNQKKAAEETERQRKLFEERIARSFEDQARLKSSLQDIQQRQAEELEQMREQLARDKAAYVEKIRSLKRAQSELNRMDPASQTARKLGSRIQLGRAEAATMERDLDAEKMTFRKKAKRVMIQNPKDWIKRNPKVVGFVGGACLSILTKVAEWEILTELTGLDITPLVTSFSGLVSPFTTGGSGDDGGDDGGDIPPDEMGGPENPYPTDVPPAYSDDPGVYNPYDMTTQQDASFDAEIDQSQQATADIVQNAEDQVPTSGIAAGEYDGYEIHDVTTDGNWSTTTAPEVPQAAMSVPLGGLAV